jgi:hypothetical protein
MMQYDPGYGDYSKERHQIFTDLSIEEVLDATGMQEKRRQ